jgi:predicted outer membrane lipoprotein
MDDNTAFVWLIGILAACAMVVLVVWGIAWAYVERKRPARREGDED